VMFGDAECPTQLRAVGLGVGVSQLADGISGNTSDKFADLCMPRSRWSTDR
jgi:hypothetical protein